MNLQNRREFLGSMRGFGIGLVTVGTLGELDYFYACNKTDVWHEIEAWVPMGIDAFEQILALVDPIATPAVTAIGNMVLASFAAVSGAIDDYLSDTNPADKATLAAKIKTILTDIANHIQQFLTAIGQTGNPILKIVAALVGLLVNVISGFITQIGAPAAFPKEFQIGQQVVLVTPTRMNRAQFIAAWNTACDSNSHSELHIPRTH